MALNFLQLAKQPNGKYYYDFNNVTMWNLTRDKVVELFLNAEKEIINNILNNEESLDGYDFLVKRELSDDVYLDMGFDRPLSELKKLIPEKVKNSSYNSRGFEEVGDCPCCGAKVRYGIGGGDEECKQCGQKLKW